MDFHPKYIAVWKRKIGLKDLLNKKQKPHLSNR